MYNKNSKLNIVLLLVFRGGMINMRKLDVNFHKLQELNSNIQLAKLGLISGKYV